jgi:hypothetical protein
MTEPEKGKPSDDLLESLLSEYSVAEPRPGYETRMLAGVRAQARQQREEAGQRFCLWTGAGAAAAMAAVVLAILFSRPAEQPHPFPAQVRHPVPQQPVQANSFVVEQSSVRPMTPRHAIQSSARAQEIGDGNRQGQNALAARRPAIFPTPVALSEQEKLMFAYLANTPREEVAAQSQRDDQKEVDGFWEDRAPLPSDPRRPGNTR